MLSLLVLGTGVASTAWPSQIFVQDFSSSSTVSDYVSATPNSGQWDAIRGSASTTITITDGALRFVRQIGATCSFSRTADFGPTPAVMIYRFRVNVVSNTTSGGTPSAKFYVGTGFPTSNGTPPYGIYAGLGIDFKSTSGTWRLRNLQNGTALPQSGWITGVQDVVWVLNNTASTVSYIGPDGTLDEVEPDRIDVWTVAVSTGVATHRFDDIMPTNPAGTITDLKFVWASNAGVMDLDNFDIRSISPVSVSEVHKDACFGANDGTMTAAFSGGVSPYQAKLDRGSFATETSPTTYRDLAPGPHEVIVQDSDGSAASVSATIAQAATPVSLSLEKTDATCNGGADGAVTATFSGGTPPYELQIDGGGYATLTSPYTFTSLAAGTHTVDLRDASPCAVSQAIQVNTVPTVYAITASAGAGGSISPTGSVSVDCGNSQTFDVTSDRCYAIADVIVDGSSVGPVARYTFTGVQADHTIDVTFVLPGSFTVTATAEPGGSITPSGAVGVACSGSQTFDVAADNCYAIADVVVDGASVGPVASYSFTDVQANHTIDATFSLLGNTITATAGASGSITPSGSVTVGCGGSRTFDVVADKCHAIADVVVDGTSVGPVASYSFSDVQAGHTIAASFSLLGPYTITATAGPGGSISPSGAASVGCGGSETFDVAADRGYAIADIAVDGTSIGPVASYTFTDIQADHTIGATFSLMGPYTITATAGPGGSIALSGTVSVAFGANETFDIVPDTDFTIKDVVVDGVSQGTMASYTFADIQADHTIDATFDATTPVVVTRLETETLVEGVAVKWAFSEPGVFATVRLERSIAEAGPWSPIDAESHEEGSLTVAVDHTTQAGHTYWYRLVASTHTGGQTTFGPVSGVAGAPGEFAMSAVRPNPSRGPMRLEFTVAKSAPVRVTLHDLQGRLVQVLTEGAYEPGRYQLSWDGVTDRGKAATGLYFVRFQVPGRTLVQRFALTQ